MPSISRVGEELNLDVRQGSTLGPIVALMRNPADLTHPSPWPVDLTGCTVRGQVRRKASDALPAATFVCQVTDPTDGKYQFTLPASATAGMECGDRLEDSKSKYVWDLEMEHPDGTVTPLYYGVLRLQREVTRT